jgi:hypothetical protein
VLLSYRHRFAFVHVPKTGGTSVCYALWPHADHPDHYWANRWLARCGIRVNHLAPPGLQKFRTHTPAATLRGVLPAHTFDGLFKFAFVRNPWDLLVSYYGFLRKPDTTGLHPSHRRRFAARLPDFEAYVRYEMRRRKISQTRMLTDASGRLLVDFVGRYESLAAHFDVVCRRIGVDAELSRFNTSARSDYRDYYTARLASLVRDHFAEDVERFGYAFDGFAQPQPTAAPVSELRWAA